MGNGWSTVPLGTLLTDIQPGFASGQHNSAGEGVPHFRPMNVSITGRIDRAVLKYVDPTVGRSDLRLRHGDVVFNNTNSPELVGKTALFENDDAPAFSNHMTRLRTDPNRLDPGYLAVRLHQAWREGWFAAHCNNHVSQASVSRDVLRDFPIELPSIEIQRSITALCRETDEQRESCGQHLASARQAVERLRQAVLAAACLGRLTEDWRLTHRTEEWQNGLASDLCIKVQSGGTPRTGFTSRPGIPFLKVYNIVDQRVDFDHRPQYIPDEVHRGVLRKSIAFPGDVIMNIVGPPLGKVAIIPPDYPEWNLNQAITIFRPGNKVLTEWLYCFLCSGSFMDREELITRGSAGQSNISLTQCRNIGIPVPPLEEQREIARRVADLLNGAEGLLAGISVANRQVASASQAIAARAFRGELTGFTRSGTGRAPLSSFRSTLER